MHECVSARSSKDLLTLSPVSLDVSGQHTSCALVVKTCTRSACRTFVYLNSTTGAHLSQAGQAVTDATKSSQCWPKKLLRIVTIRVGQVKLQGNLGLARLKRIEFPL
jgi:hypothetical protein